MWRERQTSIKRVQFRTSPTRSMHLSEYVGAKLRRLWDITGFHGGPGLFPSGDISPAAHVLQRPNRSLSRTTLSTNWEGRRMTRGAQTPKHRVPNKTEQHNSTTRPTRLQQQRKYGKIHDRRIEPRRPHEQMHTRCTYFSLFSLSSTFLAFYTSIFREIIRQSLTN